MARSFIIVFACVLLFTDLVNSQDLVNSHDDVISSSTLEEDGVEEIILPMCRNFLPYTHTKLPNMFGHSTQVEVYRFIQHQWAYMDYGCSANFRYFVCSMYLPKYDMETGNVIGPCKETCNRARKKCKGTMRQTQSRWPRNWRCANFPSKRNDDTCFKPLREPRANANSHAMYCTIIELPQCQNIPYFLGSLPNLFLQRNITELEIEMNFYDPLVSSGCSDNLQLFLCGTYIPFCTHNETPFMIPCRELCEEVHSACANHYSVLYGGLPWPNKLQCHRFPASETARNGQCFMPGDAK